jgi:hypothetical protein
MDGSRSWRRIGRSKQADPIDRPEGHVTRLERAKHRVDTAANFTAEKQRLWLSGRIALRSGSPLLERRRGTRGRLLTKRAPSRAGVAGARPLPISRGGTLSATATREYVLIHASWRSGSRPGPYGSTPTTASDGFWPRLQRHFCTVYRVRGPRNPRAIHRFACLKVDTNEFRPAISDRYRPGMQEVCGSGH